MGIQSSLYSGVSGITANSNAMSVIGNNIANSNTIGFKATRTLFSDLLSSNLSGSGGTSQVGRGVGLSILDNIFSQGTFESTESNTDLAIEGTGFFMVRNPSGATPNYTRAGSFRFDAGGYLVNPEGCRVQGYNLDDSGNMDANLTDILVESRSFSPANPTSRITQATNLNANASYLGGFDIADPTGTSNYSSSTQVFDSLGTSHLITIYFDKLDPATNPNEWGFHVTVDEGELTGGTPGTVVEVGSGTLTFDNTGALVTTTPDPAVTTTGALSWGNDSDPNQQITFVMDTTQFSSDSVVFSQQQDGYATGNLVKVDIDSEGTVIGNYSNGQPRQLARVALAMFSNPGGLVKEGNNMFSASDASGPSIISTAGAGIGSIFTNSLEQSNVDLAREFVSMITTQRGFQANSRVITTTDELLNELINLKR